MQTGHDPECRHLAEDHYRVDHLILDEQLFSSNTSHSAREGEGCQRVRDRAVESAGSVDDMGSSDRKCGEFDVQCADFMVMRWWNA